MACMVSGIDQVRVDVHPNAGIEGGVAGSVSFCNITVQGMTPEDLRRVAAAFTDAADQWVALAAAVGGGHDG